MKSSKKLMSHVRNDSKVDSPYESFIGWSLIELIASINFSLLSTEREVYRLINRIHSQLWAMTHKEYKRKWGREYQRKITKSRQENYIRGLGKETSCYLFSDCHTSYYLGTGFDFDGEVWEHIQTSCSKINKQRHL